MSTNDTGGPAFPSNETSETYNEQHGMTLRDYFAANAMNGLISMLPWVAKTEDGKPSVIACNAYEMADAMLKTRDK